MSKGSFFSGLVGGLGRSLGAGFERKRAEENQKRTYMLQLLSSGLMNDDQLPGGARREGLRQIGIQYGVKIPDELLNQVVPDVQIETDRPVIQDMPQSPMVVPPASALPSHNQQVSPQGGQQPQQQQQAAPEQQGEEYGWGEGMQPMPRNPLMDPPQIVPQSDSKSAPVTKQYTQGPGSSVDNVELDGIIQKLEAQLANPPRRQWMRDSSRNYSRADIQRMNARRMQTEEADRDLVMGQLERAYKTQDVRN